MIPGVGVPPVHFGMTHADVRHVLGDPDSEDRIAWFYDDCLLLINFDEIGKVSFIEFTWSGPRCDVWYEGVSVFDTPADELVRVISDRSVGVHGDRPLSSKRRQRPQPGLRPRWSPR